MRPLTDALPKPLLMAGRRRLIEHLILRLVSAGFVDIVINHAHLGHRFLELLGDGQRYGACLHYSPEETALETAGGIVQALPLLAEEFLVVNGDIWTDFPFAHLDGRPHTPAHLVLVPNPPHHPAGDFTLTEGRVDARPGLTFAGIGRYAKSLFEGLEPGRRPLAPLLRAAMDRGEVSGELYLGGWVDVGTPERLRNLDAELLKETP